MRAVLSTTYVAAPSRIPSTRTITKVTAGCGNVDPHSTRRICKQQSNLSGQLYVRIDAKGINYDETRCEKALKPFLLPSNPEVLLIVKLLQELSSGLPSGLIEVLLLLAGKPELGGAYSQGGYVDGADVVSTFQG